MLHVTRPGTSCANEQCHYAISMFIFLPFDLNTSTQQIIIKHATTLHNCQFKGKHQALKITQQQKHIT